MRRWAFLLRPAWLALFVVVIAFAYLCFTVLAPWQLGKNTKTSRENAQISQLLDRRPGAAENLSATPGFVGARRAVAAGDGHRALPARRRRCWPGCGSSTANPRSKC